MARHIKPFALTLLALLFMLCQGASAAKTTLWENYSPNGSTFSKTGVAVDFTKQSITAEIDLSTCTGTNENILSVGTNIGEWYGYYNIHLFYTASSKSLQLNWVQQKVASVQTDITLSSTTIKVKIASDGIYINDELQSKYTSSVLTNWSTLMSQTSVQVGSTQGATRSHAKYTSVCVEDNDESGSGGETPVTTKFVVPSFGSNYYICPATDATKCFTVTTADNDESIKISTKTDASGQQWTAKQGAYSTSYPWHFVNVMSGKALDMAGTDTKAPLQWTSENDYQGGQANKNQEWNIVSTGNGDNTYYIYCQLQTSSDYYLALNSAGTGLTKVTSKSSATAFGFLAAGGSGGGTTEPDIPADRTFDVSMVHNPQKFADHKEDAHATFIPYASTADMQADANYNKPWLTPEKAMTLNLNGTWKFKYIADYGNAAPSSAYTANGVSTSGWDDIKVPLSWEMAGYDTPVYTNEGNPGYPFTPNTSTWSTQANSRSNCDNNPLGYYRRNFTLPEDWSDKRIMVHFDGAYSAIAVYVNGSYIGYSQGANTDAEFDITNYVKKTGENNITVACFRWSDGSYLEGQDMWHLGGIHRDVYLVAMPKVFVSDHYITSTLNSGYTSGSMNVKLTVDNRDKISGAKTFSVKLLDADGGVKASGSAEYNSDANADINVKFGSLSGLTPWSAENPYLYTLVVSQKNADGNEEMAFSTKYGFREVKLNGTQVLVNGKRVFFKGVNTQDTHPLYGRAIDMETMLKDIVMMKRANINTLRTSHYPRQPKMYAMMDYYGLYCMDEADVECHGLTAQGQSLSGNSTWKAAYVDRTERMVKRDRNHPCVAFWSLGNESGSGSNFASTNAKVKELAGSNAIVHVESDINNSDLFSNMYKSVDDMKNNWTDGYGGKPYFICEYAHAMGNAMGRLKDYWNVIEGSNGIIGGCIWDWVDQAIYKPSLSKNVINGTAEPSTLMDANGYNYWTAGYDYQTPSGDYEATYMGNFVNNGIVTPDRKWSSKLTEVKKVYQYVDFTSLNNKRLSIKNKFAFTNLDQFMLVYRVLQNGYLAEEGAVDMPSVAAGSTGTVTLPYTTSTTSLNNDEFAVNVALVLKNSTPWAEAGYEIATEQFVVTPRSSSSTMASHVASGGSLSVSGNTVNGTTAEGKQFSLKFNSNGSLNSWTFNGQNIMVASPAYSTFFSIDNSRNGDPYSTSSNNSYSISSALKMNSNSTATITVNGTNYTMSYTVYPDGVVDMNVKFTAYSTAPRLGLKMQFGAGLESVEYYGRGPWANYPDRKTGSYLGRYTTTVNDLEEEYTHPQTNGDHLDLRELILSGNGTELKIETAGQASFSLSHFDESAWSEKTWRTKLHYDDCTKSANIYAHIDSSITGVGNGSCGESVNNMYKASTSGSYTLRFTPVAK